MFKYHAGHLIKSKNHYLYLDPIQYSFAKLFFKEGDSVFLNFLLENFSGHMIKRKVASAFSK